MTEINLEVIAISVADILQINKSDATCIELCGNMESDGLTPDFSVIVSAIEKSEKPVRVMIRPRGGNFVYTQDEFLKMLAAINYVRCCGAEGIVVGMLTPQGDIDPRMEEVMKAAGSMRVTFHRAFEYVASPAQAYETLKRLGVDSILSTALDSTLALPAAPIKIRLGGGLTDVLVRKLYDDGYRNFHLGRYIRRLKSYDDPINIKLINHLMHG